MPHDCAPVMVGITTANAKSKYLIVNYSTIWKTNNVLPDQLYRLGSIYRKYGSLLYDLQL
jgi:hypothetical protein